MSERSRRRVAAPRARYSPEPVTRKTKKAADLPPETPSPVPTPQKRGRGRKSIKNEPEDVVEGADNEEAIADVELVDDNPTPTPEKRKRKGRQSKKDSSVQDAAVLLMKEEPEIEPSPPEPEVVTIIKPTIIDEVVPEKSPTPPPQEEEATLIIIARPAAKVKEEPQTQVRKTAKRMQRSSPDFVPPTKEPRTSDKTRKSAEAPKKAESKEQRKPIKLEQQSNPNAQLSQVHTPRSSIDGSATVDKAGDRASGTKLTTVPKPTPPNAQAKPKRPIPQRMAPCAVGLFDSIFESQTALMKERNKTEQEKAEELKQLELSKREKARGTLGYFDAGLPQQISKPRLSVSDNLAAPKSSASPNTPVAVPSTSSIASSDSLPTLSKRSRESPQLSSPIRTPSPAGSPTPPDIEEPSQSRGPTIKKEKPSVSTNHPVNFAVHLKNRPPSANVTSKPMAPSAPIAAAFHSQLQILPQNAISPRDHSLTPSTSTSTPSQSSPSEGKKSRKSRLFRAADDPIIVIPRKIPTPGISVNTDVGNPTIVPHSLPSFTTPPPQLVANAGAHSFPTNMDFSIPPPMVGQFIIPPPDFSAPPPDFSAPPPFMIPNFPPPLQQPPPDVIINKKTPKVKNKNTTELNVDLSSIPLPPLPPLPDELCSVPTSSEQPSDVVPESTTEPPIADTALIESVTEAVEDPLNNRVVEEEEDIPEVEKSERLLQLDELVLGLPDEELAEQKKKSILEPTPISDSDEEDDGSEIDAEDSDSDISTDSDAEAEHNGTSKHSEKTAENGVSSTIGVGDARELLRRADAVLQGLSSNRSMYEQVELSAEALAEKLKEVEEPKTQPEFYGEPVPDDDEDDDALFEIAAGLPRKRKEEEGGEEEKPPSDEIIELDFYNADMHIKAHPTNNWLIDPDNGDGFALMWGSVRSNFGFVLPEEGTEVPKIVYQVKIAEFMSLKHVPFEENEPHDLRLGWSAENVHTTPGEMAHSYAICRLPRKAADNQFSDFDNRTFSVNDVVTVVLNLNEKSIEVFVNDETLGVAFTDVDFGPPGTVIHPHIGVKNVKIFVNFGVQSPEPETQWLLPSSLAALKRSEVQFFGQLDQSKMVPSRRAPSSKADCTVLMMVGLPAAGKSHWVREYLHEHPDENWIILNTDLMLSRMTVNGVPRRRVHQGRWDMVMGLAAKALSRACQLACRRRHNYILDQTNVSRDARKRKLTLFTDFERKCVVLVPSSDEYETRQLRQARAEPTNQIPPEALLELKALFALPEVGVDPVEEVIFIEPPQERLGDAVELVRRYNEDGKPYLRQRRYQYGRPREPVI